MNRWRQIFGTALLLLLVACGGGGGSTEQAPASPAQDTATQDSSASDGPVTTPPESTPTPAPEPEAPDPAPAPAPEPVPAPAPSPIPPPEPAPPTPPEAPQPLPEPEIVGPGRLEASTRLNSITVAEIAAALQEPGLKAPGVSPVYEVTNHRLSYRTIDGQGRELTASALVSVPVKPASTPTPIISYQHGTIFKDAQAPSNNASASEVAVIMASLGYIVVAADYVGYGDSKGAQHPYLLAEPSAAVVIDLLTAARTWRRSNGIADNGQLFLVGYSEGGYVTMAAHRALQARRSAHLSDVVLAVPGAGPYHVGVTMDELLRRVKEQNPLLGALISPGFLRNLGFTVRDEVRRALLRLLIPDDADVSFQTNFVDNYLADDTAAIERESNVHDWRPEAPVHLFHGRDDATVPCAASVVTLQAMQARAAPQVSLTDCTTAPSSHIACVPPYFGFMLERFAPHARNL